MSGQRHYAGAIWTNHALDRLYEREFTQEMAGQAFMHADNTHLGREKDTTHYMKRYGKHTVTVIAKKNEKGEWIILSCWIDPPIAGTKDAGRRSTYQTYQRASFWKKIGMLVLKQMGLLHW